MSVIVLGASCAIAGCASDLADPSGEPFVEEDDALPSRPVAFTRNQWGVTFSNDDGDWVIYTGCFGPRYRGGTDLTVGPGYVARLTLRRPAADGARVITNDERPLRGDGTAQTSGSLSSPGHGGLGGFGWHHARGVPPFGFTFDNSWEITGRFCAEDNGNFGVSDTRVIDGPRLEGGVGKIGIDVYFTDAWTYPTPLLRVRYRWEFHRQVVKMWALVTEHCDGGRCGLERGAPGPAFVKEPKFVSAITAGGYRRLVIFNNAGEIASNSFSSRRHCLFQGGDPRRATGQCDADLRARARFDYGTETSGAEGGCDTTSRFCLNTVMRAYGFLSGDDIAPGHPSVRWENGGVGPDAWAVRSNAREAVAPRDTGFGGALWSCHGGDTISEEQRRWEMGGFSRATGAQYDTATIGFHAWEGGTGAYDCEPLTRRFGPEGEHFAIYAQYAINAGWTIE